MKLSLLAAALCLAACGRETPDNRAVEAAPPGVAMGAETSASAPPVLPRPKDQAQLDRLILAGYTPHADHLHAPGVNECPMTKGSEAVM